MNRTYFYKSFTHGQHRSGGGRCGGVLHGGQQSACQNGRPAGAAHPPDSCTYCLLTSSPPYRLQRARLLASRHKCVTRVTTKRLFVFGSGTQELVWLMVARHQRRDANVPGKKAETRSESVRFNFSLDKGARIAGMTSIGSAAFLAKLAAGKSISVAVIGASVAENGGCTSQPGARCMNYRGIDPVSLVHGAPRLRLHKGWIIQWWEWLIATFPHSEHTCEWNSNLRICSAATSNLSSGATSMI